MLYTANESIICCIFIFSISFHVTFYWYLHMKNLYNLLTWMCVTLLCFVSCSFSFCLFRLGLVPGAAQTELLPQFLMSLELNPWDCFLFPVAAGRTPVFSSPKENYKNSLRLGHFPGLIKSVIVWGPQMQSRLIMPLGCCSTFFNSHWVGLKIMD